MRNIKKNDNLKVNSYGSIGSLMNGYINNYLKEEEIENINNKIDILNSRLKDFDIFKYKIINRFKIKNLIVKTLSEDSEDFMEITINILKISEDNFENIIDGFMSLSKGDIDVLYFNLWKKRNNDKFDMINLKKEINDNFEFTPDLIMNYEYQVNKNEFVKKENSLIIGQSLTLMPTQESSNIFNVFEKLSFNNFIKLSKYIPNKTKDSFNTYLCFKFTYLGIYLCGIMEKLEKGSDNINE